MAKSKYTNAELKGMALHLKQVREKDPKRYELFLVVIAMFANVSIETINHRIQKYSVL